MAAEQLQIKVQADVQNAVSGLNNLNKSLEQTNKAAVSTGTAGMGNLTKGSNQATFALQNFGRVASDAPFGIIGIANNIDPLVQSFVTLRKETGSNKAALAALTSSLTGGGGLILAVSLVTSALQFAQIGLSRWGISSKKAKEEQDSLKAGTDQFITTVTKQRIEVEALAKVAADANQTEKARGDALKRLNEILPDTIGKLNQQNIATKEGAEILKDYIKAVEAKATAELLSNRIAENSIKIFDERNKLNEENKRIETEIAALRQRLGRVDIGATGRAGESAALRALSLQSDINKLVKEQSNLQKESQRNIDALTKGNEQLRGEYEKQLPLVLELDKNQKKSKQTVNEITDLLSKYREELKGINWDEQNRQIDGTNERVKLAGETLKSLYLAGVKETSAAWKEVSKDFDNFADLVLKRITKISKAYDDVAPPKEILPTAPDLQGLPQGNERGFIPMPKESVDAALRMSGLIGAVQKQFDALNKVQGQNNKYWQELKITPEILKQIGANVPIQQITAWAEKNNEILAQQRMLAEVIQGAISPAIDAVFKAFEEGKNPFDALIDSVRQFTVELGKAIVKQLLFNAISNVIAPGAGQAKGFLEGFFMRGDTIRNATVRA